MLTYADVLMYAARLTRTCALCGGWSTSNAFTTLHRYTYAHVCSNMLTYAHVCSRMLAYAMVAYADVDLLSSHSGTGSIILQRSMQGARQVLSLLALLVQTQTY
jgi:hypothetical protein